MSSLGPAPTHVVTIAAVKWSIAALGSRPIDPAFIYYLHLRRKWIVDELHSASASDVKALLRVPGGPANKPHYRPLRERRQNANVIEQGFWVSQNLAGSWSPRSLRRLGGAGWLVNSDNQYVMPEDHAARARSSLLYDEPVGAYAFAGYFLRNDGLIISGDPEPDDLIAALRDKFDFGSTDSDFDDFFDSSIPEVDFAWLEPMPTEAVPDA